MPTRLLSLKWLVTSRAQHQWLTSHLEEWSLRAGSAHFDDPSLEQKLVAISQRTKDVAEAERTDSNASGDNSNRLNRASAKVVAAHKAILEHMRSIATECDFPAPVNIKRQQAWNALVEESGAICWCINAGNRSASGRVDALVSFNAQGKVTQAEPWGSDASDLESIADDTVLVAASPGAWAWDPLRDESMRKCILESLREISFPPQPVFFSVLYSITIGEPTRATPNGTSGHPIQRRLCR